VPLGLELGAELSDVTTGKGVRVFVAGEFVFVSSTPFRGSELTAAESEAVSVGMKLVVTESYYFVLIPCRLYCLHPQ